MFFFCSDFEQTVQKLSKSRLYLTELYLYSAINLTERILGINALKFY